MTKLRDLYVLPEEVYGSAFVVKLSDALRDPGPLLEEYVVTDQLSQCFDSALSIVKHAVNDGVSMASYLHGSFGSGKSHFMAVLYSILQQERRALEKSGLAGPIQKHNPWLQDKKFLLIPYHMIGATSMESAILGKYAERVRELHPEASTPGVYLGTTLLKDAEKLRNKLGDDAFFQGLNQADADSGGSGGWGIKGTWTSEAYETASSKPPGDNERQRLLGILIATYFSSYGDAVQKSGEAFLPLDKGLSVISQHAHQLGYDGLVLFLDELILWLASKASDPTFVNEEGPKLAKLVEAQTSDRPCPIVSIIARQRELSEFVGEGLTGFEGKTFSDLLKWWNARFETITLEDRNLPEIVTQRLLRPQSAAARDQIDESFAEAEKVRDDVLRVLQTERFSRSDFRKVYPFSPALVEALVAVSNVLQRERTALKVMAQLLVERADGDLGVVIPVGDLFDAIASGDAPFSGEAQIYFDNARKLYEQKLVPLLEEASEITRDEVLAKTGDEGRRRLYRANDRLMKTLLIAGLAPEAPVLKDLTSARLAALNHGTVKTPIPGGEAQVVLQRVRNWAGRVGEIKVSDATDPVIALQLTGVDTDALLQKVQTVDSTGARKRLLRDMIYDDLELPVSNELFDIYEVDWKGTTRSFEVAFENVRDLPDESFRAEGESRRIIIDFPFDESGHTPQDDLQRLREFSERNTPSRTLVWLPSFFNDKTLQDLGTLVRLEHLLQGDRLREEARDLSELDRHQARIILENQRGVLRDRLRHIIMGAYGVSRPVDGTLNEVHSLQDHVQFLDASASIRPPTGAVFRDGLNHLLTQVLEAQYPAHPDFGDSVKTTNLRKILGVAREALATRDRRVPVEKSLRPLMNQIAVPLQLGDMGETHFVLGNKWFEILSRCGEGASVGQLRTAMDEPKPRGLTPGVQNLILMIFGDQADSSFALRGGPYEPSLERLPDEAQLKKIQLPTPECWDEARSRAQRLFGLTPSPLCNASNVNGLADQCGEMMKGPGEDVRRLAARLEELHRSHDLDPAAAHRVRSARSTVQLWRALSGTSGTEFVDRLASASLDTSAEAMATSWRSAKEVLARVDDTNWGVLDALPTVAGEQKADAQNLWDELIQLLEADEYVSSIIEKLQGLETRATELVLPKRPPKPGWTRTHSGAIEETNPQSAAAKLKELLDETKRMDSGGGNRLTVDWNLYKRKGS